MHILFFTDNFAPEVNAPASRGYDHCREWLRAGCDVTVITSVPNFPLGVAYPGFRNRLWQREEIDGIKVIRVWTFMSANEGFFFRILDYLSFMLMAFLASFFVRRVDAVMGTSPQFFTVCAAWAAGALRGIPFVFELRDLWPDSIRAVGVMREGWLLKMLSQVELFLYRRAALIIAVTHSFKQILAERGIDPDKIVVVTNGADLARFSPRAKDVQLQAELGLEGCFVAGYVGTHGLAHGLATLIETVRLLRDSGQDRVRILMLGSGEEKARLQAQAAAEGLDTILFLDSVSKEEVARYWSLLDLSLIHLRRDPVFRSVIPSKLFEAMAMGVPVLLGVEGEAAALVTRHGAGVPVTPEDPRALADCVLALRDDPERLAQLRANGIEAARQHARPALAQAMLAAIQSVVQSRPTAAVAAPAEQRQALEKALVSAGHSAAG